MESKTQWLDVAAAAAVEENTTVAAEIDGYSIIVLRCGPDFYAMEDRCTHDGEPLGGAQVEDCQVICPRHGARFCARSGAALTPPAYEPVRTFRVRLEGGRILVERPA